MHDATRAELARGLEHVERSLDVGIDVGIGRMVGERDRDERGEVQHRIAPLHRRLHAVRVANVAGEDVERVAYLLRRVVEPSPRIEGIVEDEGADIDSLRDQRFHEVGPDEAIGARDQNFQT